jgi:hypothetical protein
MSRWPLRLLRLEWRPDSIECDWICRPHDEWDRDLSERSRRANVSLQALEDAVEVRHLLFTTFPHVVSAVFRVYRELPDEQCDLIIAGRVERTEPDSPKVHSMVMRAKLCGLQFCLDEGKLQAFSWEDSDRVPQTKEAEIPRPMKNAYGH